MTAERKEPTRLQDRIDWDELAELTARDMAEAEAAIRQQRNDSDTCECGNRKSERADFCRACAVADEREE